MRKHAENGCAALEQQRQAIDVVDSELVRLLNQRAQIVSELASVKKSSGLPVHDLRRERQILERICSQNPGPLDSQALINIFRRIMQESRKIQQSSMRQSGKNLFSRRNINGDQYGSKRI